MVHKSSLCPQILHLKQTPVFYSTIWNKWANQNDWWLSLHLLTATTCPNNNSKNTNSNDDDDDDNNNDNNSDNNDYNDESNDKKGLNCRSVTICPMLCELCPHFKLTWQQWKKWNTRTAMGYKRTPTLSFRKLQYFFFLSFFLSIPSGSLSIDWNH